MLRVRDMPHMARYVYDMYLDNIRQRNTQYEVGVPLHMTTLARARPARASAESAGQAALRAPHLQHYTLRTKDYVHAIGTWPK